MCILLSADLRSANRPAQAHHDNQQQKGNGAQDHRAKEAVEPEHIGSRADGANREDSDVDLIIEFSAPITLLTISKLRCELEELLGAAVGAFFAWKAVGGAAKREAPHAGDGREMDRVCK